MRKTEEWPDHDRARGFVIRAESEQEARSLAAKEDGWKEYDGGAVWLNPTETSCEIVETEGSPDVILCDFNAG